MTDLFSALLDEAQPLNILSGEIVINSIPDDYYTSMTLVGSRVTCKPPPVNTDVDWLVLVDDPSDLHNYLEQSGWELGGSDIPDESNETDEDELGRELDLVLGDTVGTEDAAG